MSGQEFTNVTLAQVDPAILTCWEEMLKRGEECSLLLKHSKGRVTFSLQGTTSAKSSSVAEISPSPVSSANNKKKRKQKRRSKKRLEALLSYHQRLVEEKGLPPSRLMLQQAGAAKVTFKCEQCEFSSTSQRDVKDHKSRVHTEQSLLGEELQAKLACMEKAMKEKDEMLELLTASKDSLEKDRVTVDTDSIRNSCDV